MKKLVIGLGIIIIALLAILLLVPSNTDNNQSDNEEQLMVVTTFFPLYDFTRQLANGVDTVEIDMLFAQTPEVSSFKPSDVQKLNNADVLVMNGAGLEPILDELLDAAENEDLVIVNTSEGIALLESEDGHGHGHDHGHDHGDIDPHIWLDPNKAALQVANIADALVQIDPDNAVTYQLNGESYVEQLKNLDRSIASTIATFTSKDIITFHPAFGYFVDRYGLNLLAVFEATPGKEPSPSDLAEILELAREHDVKALFAEPQFSAKVVQTIADDLGIEVRTLNPLESADLDNDTYIDLMQENLQELQAVLQ